MSEIRDLTVDDLDEIEACVEGDSDGLKLDDSVGITAGEIRSLVQMARRALRADEWCRAPVLQGHTFDFNGDASCATGVRMGAEAAIEEIRGEECKGHRS